MLALYLYLTNVWFAPFCRGNTPPGVSTVSGADQLHSATVVWWSPANPQQMGSEQFPTLSSPSARVTHDMVCVSDHVCFSLKAADSQALRKWVKHHGVDATVELSQQHWRCDMRWEGHFHYCCRHVSNPWHLPPFKTKPQVVSED